MFLVAGAEGFAVSGGDQDDAADRIVDDLDQSKVFQVLQCGVFARELFLCKNKNVRVKSSGGASTVKVRRSVNKGGSLRISIQNGMGFERSPSVALQ